MKFELNFIIRSVKKASLARLSALRRAVLSSRFALGRITSPTFNEMVEFAVYQTNIFLGGYSPFAIDKKNYYSYTEKNSYC